MATDKFPDVDREMHILAESLSLSRSVVDATAIGDRSVAEEADLAVIYMLHTLLTVKHVSTGKHRIFLFSVHADYTD